MKDKDSRMLEEAYENMTFTEEPLTRDEVYQILTELYAHEVGVDEAMDAIWGHAFDDFTQLIQ